MSLLRSATTICLLAALVLAAASPALAQGGAEGWGDKIAKEIIVPGQGGPGQDRSSGRGSGGGSGDSGQETTPGNSGSWDAPGGSAGSSGGGSGAPPDRPPSSSGGSSTPPTGGTWTSNCEQVGGQWVQVTYRFGGTGMTLDSTSAVVEVSRQPCTPPSEPAKNPCTQWYFDGSRLHCAWSDLFPVEASAEFPVVAFKLHPYPASLVNWPNRLEWVNAPVAEGEGFNPGHAYGACAPGNDDKVKDISLKIRLYPYGYPEVLIPGLGKVVLHQGLQLPGFPTASHPDAGGRVVEGFTVKGRALPAYIIPVRTPYRAHIEARWTVCKYDTRTVADITVHDDGTVEVKNREERYNYHDEPQGWEVDLGAKDVSGLAPDYYTDVAGTPVELVFENPRVSVVGSDDQVYWSGRAVFPWVVYEMQGVLGKP